MGGELMALGAITVVLIGYRQSKPLRRARALKRLHGIYRERTVAVQDSIDKQARDLIKLSGYSVSKIERIFEADCDGDREVLFHGRWMGDKRAKIAGDEDEAIYTLTLRGDETGFVSSGW
jgi:hypothetical protein